MVRQYFHEGNKLQVEHVLPNSESFAQPATEPLGSIRHAIKAVESSFSKNVRTRLGASGLGTRY
jgi:hypothetical protein